MNLSVEHVLMFALVVCVFYYMRCNRVEGYSQDIYECLVDESLTWPFRAEWAGNGECVKRGGFENKPLYQYYHSNDPSVEEMVKRINSGEVHEGGFNVADPEKCESAVKKCYKLNS